jgi:hypothetical protein
VTINLICLLSGLHSSQYSTYTHTHTYTPTRPGSFARCLPVFDCVTDQPSFQSSFPLPNHIPYQTLTTLPTLTTNISTSPSLHSLSTNPRAILESSSIETTPAASSFELYVLTPTLSLQFDQSLNRRSLLLLILRPFRIIESDQVAFT